MNTLILDGNTLSVDAVAQAAQDFSTSLELDKNARKRMERSRAVVDAWVEKGEVVYGITTGFGEFANVHIGVKDVAELQENLILSHSAGCGDPMPREAVRAMMILRINALAKGFSGIRIETVEHLIKMFNAGIVPVIPSQGSVGSSGDLVQLAHLVLTMMGKGEVWLNEKRATSPEFRAPSNESLKKIGLKPITLSAKEGLALINGTQMQSAYGVLSVTKAKNLERIADVACALSCEALRGTDRAFDARLHATRPHAGQSTSASNLRALMAGSEIRESHRDNDSRVQDAYSLRCAPQVHGASRDAINYVWNVLTTEINSATDNPLIFADTAEHIEGGNFHGQPVALAMDFLAIALSELANISERRTERMVNGSLSGLPRFLTTKGGLNSGMMIAQYTAASLVSENKVLSHPASVDSIPTSANQEDHNSMGSIAAQKCWRIVQNVENVLAIELLVGAQGVDFHRPMKCGVGSEAAYNLIRKHVPHLDNDRLMHDDIAKVRELVRSGEVVRAVEKVTKLV